MSKMKKFVAVMNIPSPYRLHLLGEMARQLKERGVEFHCHFMNRGHKDRPASWLNPKIDFPHTYWRNFGPDQHEFNPGLVLKLMFEKPDWILVGGAFDTLTAVGLSLLARAKTKICWIEGNAKSPGKMTGPEAWLKFLTVSRYSRMAVPGKQGKDYLALLTSRTTRKMPEPVILPNLIDETKFQSFTVEKFQGGKIEGFRELAENKIGEWLKGVAREAFVAALEGLITEKENAGEYRFRREDERRLALEGAKRFFDEFSRKIVALSDGRCVYFAPDARSKGRNGGDLARCWAEYAFHAVSNGGRRLVGKCYNERWYHPHKAANFGQLVATLKGERCFVRLRDDARNDAILFLGDVAAGLSFDVVTRLDEFGNMDANLTEVTFEVASRREKKLPRLVPLTEAVQAVVHHQTTAGSNPQDGDNIPNNSLARKGGRTCIIPARFDPVKGLKEFFGAIDPEMLKGWRLVVMGHGPEEDVTMEIVRKRGLLPFVEVVHSVPYEEMPARYAAADLCIIPSIRDQNPLAAVEALHSGLPLALSDQAGNVDEAVTEGRNGWVLPVKDKAAYEAKLREVFATPVERLREMGRLSKAENAKFWETKGAIKRFLDEVL